MKRMKHKIKLALLEQEKRQHMWSPLRVKRLDYINMY